MAVNVDSIEVFSSLSSKISSLLFGRTEKDRSIISKTLDDLNSLNYRYTIVTNSTKAVLLVNQCCSFIPTDDRELVQKCCRLICNLAHRQHIAIEGRTLNISIQWCLNALKRQERNVIVEILQALDALLHTNVNHITPITDIVLKEIINLLSEVDDKYSSEVILLSLQCLEACTVVPKVKQPTENSSVPLQIQHCFQIFKSHLCKKVHSFDLFTNKIFYVCLYGLQNIIIQYTEFLEDELGSILGIVKTFMLYGITGVDYIPPKKLLPASLSIPEVSYIVKEKRGGKLTKHRKHRASRPSKKEKQSIDDVDNRTGGYVPITSSLEYNSDTGVNGPILGNRLKTSDSDFSDNEAGRSSNHIKLQGRVRQSALNLFFNVVKITEKSLMFSYWTSFIPDSNLSGQHNILTCILKDPSSKNRIASLNVLLLLLTTSKLYLLQAESSEKSTSFTPFSVVLGLMIKELHIGLSLALYDISVPVLTQVLKCVAALVQATPYHKLPQGLVTKIVRNVKPYIYHRDASVQGTALIVLGCILASEPPISETKQVMVKHHCVNESGEKLNVHEHPSTSIDCFDFAEFSDSDSEDNLDDIRIPWLLKRCLSNLGIDVEKTSANQKEIPHIVPAPVKLESLQILSVLSRNYFDLFMAPHITYITKALDLSLSDKYMDLRLHSGRAVDFIGQAICRYVNTEDLNDANRVKQCISFWKCLLSKSLVELFQCEEHPILRATGCDCLGSIGSQIFEQLSRNEQILCVTLLFSCTRDVENSVRGAAVRGLAICVLYPSLRDDPGFVVDTAEAIHRTLKDESLMVRVKASWSLGNLSDALVLNSLSPTDYEELPEGLLLKLLEAGVNGASDNDKIKVNAVRAVGNLMQLITETLIMNNEFVVITEQAFSALVKSSISGSNMKVRWNACYALKNALKNSSLYSTSSSKEKFGTKNWQGPVFNSLNELVVSFKKNFKVRINAALALSSPTSRDNYGDFYYSVWIALLKALENSENIDDFNEYKHRDQLVEQLCLSLSHLVTLLRKDDLLQLKDDIQLYFEIFKTHIHKVLERLVPEKSTVISSASYALTHLNHENGLSLEQRNVLKCLMDIFVPI